MDLSGWVLASLLGGDERSVPQKEPGQGCVRSAQSQRCTGSDWSTAQVPAQRLGTGNYGEQTQVATVSTTAGQLWPLGKSCQGSLPLALPSYL